MTLPSGGILEMYSINQEFGRGYDLNAYRGTPWYTDAGGSGTFSGGTISIAEFFGKRATSPHHPFGFDNFSGSPSRSNGDLTIAGYGTGLTAYGGARAYNAVVDFYINNVGCIVGLANGTPSTYPGDGSQYGIGLRQDGTIFFNTPASGFGTVNLGFGYNPGDIVSFGLDGSNQLYIGVNGGFNFIGSMGTSFYPTAFVEGGTVTLQTSGGYGFTTYWYP